MKKETIKIQVLGSGCPTCEKLHKLTKQAVKDLGLEAEINYITDIQKIVELGVMSSPVLTINGKVVISGSVLGLEELKEIIKENN